MKKKLEISFFCLLFSVFTLLAQKVDGVVLDELGEPAIGATILIKGTNRGTVTDIDGRFSIDVNELEILVFSYIGYETREMKPIQNMRVTLNPSMQQLQEVVVTGMTQMDRRLFTGATDKLVAGDVKLDGMADISRSLEGRSAGVSVQNVSGTFGTAPKIRVRGATSIYGSSKPLWVVDGVIMDDVVEVSADALSSGDAVTLISSAIAGLNSDDIESFQILKDGSATSVYGARAMSGVIVITTKKGKAGTSRISYTGEYTTRLKPSYRNFNISNSQEQMGIYKEMEQKGWLTLGDLKRASDTGVYGKMYELIATAPGSEDLDFTLPHLLEAKNRYLQEAEMRNTDWFDELFSNNLMHNHSISISSGTDKTTTYASLSAMYDEGWYKRSSIARYTANLNSSHRVSERLLVNIITNASYRNQEAPGTLGRSTDAVNGNVKREFDINPYSYALNSARVLDPKEYYKSNYAPFNIHNELENNYIDLNVIALKFQGEIRWHVLPELQLSALGALKYNTTSQEHFIKDNSNQAMAYREMGDATIMENNPYLYKNPEDLNALPISVLPQGGIYRRTDYKMLGYDFRFSAQWNKIFDDTHITSLFASTEINSFDRDMTYFNGWGMQYTMGYTPFYVYEFFKRSIENGADYYSMNMFRNRAAAFVVNPTYSYEGRYVAMTTFRYEGTNRLGKSRSSRWLPTWNLSGAWNVHEEEFFNGISALSNLSLKGSYSLTAENPSTETVSNSLMVISSYKPFRPEAGMIESGLVIMEPENSELTYEKKNELNIGLEVGLLRNRINLVADWYNRNNYDLIGVVNTQGLSGTIDKLANVANMESHGIEFTLSTRNIVRKDYSWTTDFTFSNSKTKITNLKGKPSVMGMVSGYGGPMEGYAYRTLFSFRFNGLSEDGIPSFVDSSNRLLTDSDINFNRREDLENILKYEGPTDPTITGGLGNIFTYKNFRLNLFLTYSFGNKIRLDPVFSSNYSDLTAMPKEFKNRWVLPGDEKVTDVPVILGSFQHSANSGLTRWYNAYNYSDARIADGGFIRLKEISLGYEFPKTVIPKGINDLSLKLQATNLLLLYADSKLNGQDPEFFRSGGVAAPMPKQFTLTLKLGI